MEDLAGQRLDSVLLRAGDPTAASRLVQFAETLGRMHALPIEPEPAQVYDLDRISDAWEIELDREDRTALNLTATAYTQGDVGPDNAMVVDDRVLLFDFEMGGTRHPLTDAVTWHMGFPFGRGTGAIPEDVRDQMDAAYEAARGVAVETHDWGCAFIFQLLGRLGRFHEWEVLNEDFEWGATTGRQRLLALLAARPPESPLARALDDLERRLREAWPGVAPTLPMYPAFVVGLFRGRSATSPTARSRWPHADGFFVASR